MKKHLLFPALLALALLISALPAFASGEASEEASAEPAATIIVEGEIYAEGYTAGSSCLVDPTALTFNDTGAVIRISGDALDDSLIDSTHAVVTLLPGDGYEPSELKFTPPAFPTVWQDGAAEYNLAQPDLMWNNDGYAIAMEGCGREWSCFGGDGAGHYYFRLGVSGVVYDGEPLADFVIPVHVYIYGRSATDLAIMNYGTLTPAWRWEGGDYDLPVLCDAYEDDFDILWPNGVDASALTAADIAVTLRSEYGAEKTLEPETDYYLLAAGRGKTVVAVTWRNWAYTPVYSTMTMAVDGEKLDYDRENFAIGGLSETFDIASVYVHGVQSGGMLAQDHAVCYVYYGVKLDSWRQVQTPALYRLRLTDEDGAVLYYAEKNGAAYLTEDKDAAMTWDATGLDEMNYQLVDGHVVYVTLLSGRTAEKAVGGETYTFDKVYSNAVPTSAFDYYGSLDVDPGIETLPGYVLGESWLDQSMTAWLPSINTGWLAD